MKGHEYQMFKKTTLVEHPPEMDIDTEKNSSFVIVFMYEL